MSEIPRYIKSRQIVFKQTLLPLTGDKFVEDCPFDADIVSVGFQFPPGCDGLVDISAGHGDIRCFPTDGFLSLDGANPVFNCIEPVAEKEPLWVEIRNADVSNSHSVSISLMLQGKERGL